MCVTYRDVDGEKYRQGVLLGSEEGGLLDGDGIKRVGEVVRGREGQAWPS